MLVESRGALAACRRDRGLEDVPVLRPGGNSCCIKLGGEIDRGIWDAQFEGDLGGDGPAARGDRARRRIANSDVGEVGGDGLVQTRRCELGFGGGVKVTDTGRDEGGLGRALGDGIGDALRRWIEGDPKGVRVGVGARRERGSATEATGDAVL